MTQAMRDSITKAIDLPATPLDRTTRVRNALYLAATASQYQGGALTLLDNHTTEGHPPKETGLPLFDLPLFAA